MGNLGSKISVIAKNLFQHQSSSLRSYTHDILLIIILLNDVYKTQLVTCHDDGTLTTLVRPRQWGLSGTDSVFMGSNKAGYYLPSPKKLCLQHLQFLRYLVVTSICCLLKDSYLDPHWKIYNINCGGSYDLFINFSACYIALVV